jgi:AraC family transcriptional regulator
MRRQEAQLELSERLDDHVPGLLTLESPDAGWDGVAVRGYTYPALDVELPPLVDHMVVAYRRADITMAHHQDGRWDEERLGRGDVTLVPRGSVGRWVYADDVDVVHVYLSQAELAATCREMYEVDVEDVELQGAIRADDPSLYRTAMLLAAEAKQGVAGSRLMVDSLSSQLAVHLLRRHSRVRLREPGVGESLTFAQVRAVQDHVSEHIGGRITLEELAAAAGMNRPAFGRAFRAAFGTTPHDFVLAQRVEHAQLLLRRLDVSLLEVALRCGFADQSHLTREFKKRLDVTPGRFRDRR